MRLFSNQLILLTVAVFLLYGSISAQVDNTKYIDPTIGNVSRFLVPTYPTIQLPNQMMRMFPVKKDYISDQVDAFPLQVPTHRSAGIMQMKVALGEVNGQTWRKKMNIDHDLEIVHPWYYSTYLIDDDIRVSFVPGKKSAIYKIDFPKGEKKNILIKGKGEMEGNVLADGAIHLKEKIVYKTRGIFSETRVMYAYVYAQLTNSEGQKISGADINTESRKLSISMSDNSASDVCLKYAVSYISFAQAKINFEKEVKGTSLEKLAKAGKEAWEKVSNQIQVEGGTEAQKRTFYTALYRTYERMLDVNEYGKYYSGYDGKVHESNRPFYVDDWVWDTYRATHPLRTILDPELQNDMLNSYVLMYEQSGWMPTFPQVHGNHMCMNSYHSASLFIDAYRKGLSDYDVEQAYKGIEKNLMEGTFIPWRQGTPRRPIDDFYHEQGYFPSLKIGETETEPQMDGFEKRQPVPVTLGISYDFWSLAELAKELGKTEDYKKYTPRGLDYKKLWHPKHRLFIPKDEDGEWLDIDPKKDGGKGYREYYDENNGWTYAWDVPHDIAGLTDLLGGKEAAEARLDQLFREPLGMKRNEFYVNGANSTGLVGQFSMGNEPSFHIPYLYNYFGAPWKTQKRTRFLLDVWFKDNIFGIPGDEDGGGMTAFVVFSAMGLYPVSPGLPFYDITSPIFEKTTIELTNGKKFTVVAKGASKTKKYIQKAFINGKEINSPFIAHQQIMDGGTLELVLDELPNKEWGKDAKIPYN